MNFYSDDIVNEIIDKEALENVIDELNNFKAQVKYLFMRFSIRYIGHKYTNYLLSDEKNKIVFYCIDNQFSISNCPTCMIYRKHNDAKPGEIHYYILLICTKHQFKNQGYASLLLNGFIERVKAETQKYAGSKKIKIILSSIESAVTFYESYGFVWTRETLAQHPQLMKYEKYDEKKEYFILELAIT